MPPARPWDAPRAPEPAARPAEQPQPAPRHGGNFMSVAIFLLLVSGVLIQAYRDLSQPGAWDYWSDRYFSPSMTASPADNVDLGGRRRQALALHGKIGAASASWFRERLDEAKLKPGDLVVISSLGGDVGHEPFSPATGRRKVAESIWRCCVLLDWAGCNPCSPTSQYFRGTYLSSLDSLFF